MSSDIEKQANPNTAETPSVEQTRRSVYPEKKSVLDRLGRKGQFAVAGAIATGLVAGGLVVGAKLGENNNEAPEPNPNPTPTDIAPTVEPTVEVAPSVPEEAQEYVEKYSTVFEDALATYYSEKAYTEANPGSGLTINEDYVANYDFEAGPFANGEISPLGFSIERMSVEKPVDLASSIDVFNSSIPNLNLLVNMLAKNPGHNHIEVIKDEFSMYTGLSNTESENLVDLLLGVTQEYGSNSFYSINSAVDYDHRSEPNATVVIDAKPGIDAVDDEGNVTAFSIGMNMSIEIETYDNTNEFTSQVATLENTQFTVNKAINFDPLKSGYVGIGSR